MKQKDKKILKRGLVLFIVLVLIFVLLNELSRLSLRNDRYDLIAHLKYMPEDSLDVLILGNSHAQLAIDDALLSDMLDANIYNAAFSQQQAATSYYILSKAFKYQSPDTVVLDAYTLIQQIQGGYTFIPLSPAKLKYFSMIRGEGFFAGCFFPISDYHNFWARSHPFRPMIANLTSGSEQPAPYETLHVMSKEAVTKHETINSEERIDPFYENRFPILDEINDLCQKNDAQLIITMLPFYGPLLDKIDYESIYYDKLKSFCDERVITYYDYNMQSTQDWSYKYFQEQDYTQNTHLNIYGQRMATLELAQYLSDTSGSYTMHGYTQHEVQLTSLFDELRGSAGFILADDCPYPISEELNPGLTDTLSDMGIQISGEPKGADSQPYIYSYSDGRAVLIASLPEGLTCPDDGVAIFILDADGTIKKRAFARWDEFSTAIIK